MLLIPLSSPFIKERLFWDAWVLEHYQEWYDLEAACGSLSSKHYNSLRYFFQVYNPDIALCSLILGRKNSVKPAIYGDDISTIPDLQVINYGSSSIVELHSMWGFCEFL